MSPWSGLIFGGWSSCIFALYLLQLSSKCSTQFLAPLFLPTDIYGEVIDTNLRLSVSWYAPFLSGGGYCSEATSFMSSWDSVVESVSKEKSSFVRSKPPPRVLSPLNMTLSFQMVPHGDSFNSKYVDGLAELDSQMLRKYRYGHSVTITNDITGAQQTTDLDNDNIYETLSSLELGQTTSHLLKKNPLKRRNIHVQVVICHSEPGAWSAPYPRYHTTQCPPSHAVRYKQERKQRAQQKQQRKQEGGRPNEDIAQRRSNGDKEEIVYYTIGRTMFETDTIPSGWVDRLNFMDEIWVPTDFSRDIFEAAGVPSDRLRVVAEPVDTTFFHPVESVVKWRKPVVDVTHRAQAGSGDKTGRTGAGGIGDIDGAGVSQVEHDDLSSSSQLNDVDTVDIDAETGEVGVKGRDRDSGSSSIIDFLSELRSEGLLDWSDTETVSDMERIITTSATTVFLFVGKFEHRKGLDILLEAYTREFGTPCMAEEQSPPPPKTNSNTCLFLGCGSGSGSGSGSSDKAGVITEAAESSSISLHRETHADVNDSAAEADDVLLLILTSAYHSSEEFEEEVEKILSKQRGHPSSSAAAGSEVEVGVRAAHMSRPKYKVLSGVPQSAMPYLYTAADALVVPSHGEGWGRPHMEAMACGTPVLATNWSGPTAFIQHEHTGYLIKVLPELVDAPGWRGHKWAQPDVEDLQHLLRKVHSDRSAAHRIGEQARQAMLRHYALPRMGNVLLRELWRIVAQVVAR